MSLAHRFRVGAVLTFVIIAITAWLHWPLPELGFVMDPDTGIVVVVTPGLAAARGGMQVGDEVTSIYGYPRSTVNSRLLLVPLPWEEGAPSPVEVLRGGSALELWLQAGQPELSLQVDKALRTLVAIVCWLTGAMLGASAQGSHPHLRWTAWFWVLLGATLSIYQLAQAVSFVLTVVALWVLGSILAPSAVMLHMWYPSRPLGAEAVRRARHWWLAGMLLVQIVFLGLLAIGRTTIDRLELLDRGTTLLFIGSFLLSAAILWRAYRDTTIAHIRRQIRLIGLACIVVACAWAILVLGEQIVPQVFKSLSPVTLTVVASIIPLAYLYGGLSADLFQIDRLARYLATHALTLVVMLVLLATVIQFGFLDPAPLMVVLIIVAAYRPFFEVARRLRVYPRLPGHTYRALTQAVAQLGSTLDADELAAIMSSGLRETFGGPPLALYIQHEANTGALSLAVAYRLKVPEHVTIALLDEAFAERGTLLSIGDVQQRVGTRALDGNDAALIFAPLASLWGLIRQPRGAPLGLVILGPRADLDPYREQDLHEVERLLTAASLALTNSASYQRQVQAQHVIRRLYRHLQEAQDLTASAIAREIHDEVLNVNVRLNILALEGLLRTAETAYPQLNDELSALLESEQTTGTMLRLICEQLWPAYLDDPLGLVTSLRRVVERAGVTWQGKLGLEVEQAPTPVERQTHREFVLIVREAVANAVKHADATEIVVLLRFPAEASEPLKLAVRDNGTTKRPVAPKPGHLGLHFMRESADAIGATITWRPRESGGTEVLVVAPLASHQEEEVFALANQWLGEGQPGAIGNGAAVTVEGEDTRHRGQ